MTTTAEYREKYAPRQIEHGRLFYPAGRNDILDLCDKVDALETIIRKELMEEYKDVEVRKQSLEETLLRILS